MAETPGVPEAAVKRDAVASAHRNLIVLGASAGGVEALRDLVSGLPKELPASVLIVLHMMPSRPSLLHGILERAGQLPVAQAQGGERLERGRVYVAPPGRNMVLLRNTIVLSDGTAGDRHSHRPAIDPLFFSAAEAHGPRTIGAVLTGTLSDGAEGLRLIKARGGAAVVQDPSDAEFEDMPRNAINRVEPDRIVPLRGMAEALCELLGAPPGRTRTPPRMPDKEDEADAGDALAQEPAEGTLLPLTCPTCGGVLLGAAKAGALGFVCRSGHSYSPESMVDQQGAELESTLWHAIRGLQERAELLRRLARHAARRGDIATRTRLAGRATVAAEQAEEIRRTIDRLHGTDSGAPTAS